MKCQRSDKKMKINSEKLFEFVNNLGTDEKVMFKVFEDENYVTEIYWMEKTLIGNQVHLHQGCYLIL